VSALFDLLTVHCFWPRCRHVERDADSRQASHAMQRHYDTAHDGEADRLLEEMYGPRPGGSR